MSGKTFNRLMIVLALVLIVVIWFDDRGLPDEVSGRAKTIDGDSLVVGGEEIRLVGIDAPEARQMCERNGREWTCGREAARRLRGVIARRNVTCEIEDIDKHDRLLAVCSIGDVELNRWMVENGWAVAYGRYRDEERMAENQRRGIWQGRFERPRDWRDRDRLDRAKTG